jgi:hypothetical protein
MIRFKSTETEKMEKVKNVLANKFGTIPVIIYYEDTKQSLQAPKSMWISDEESVKQLSQIFGEDNVKKV